MANPQTVKLELTLEEIGAFLMVADAGVKATGNQMHEAGVGVAYATGYAKIKEAANAVAARLQAEAKAFAEMEADPSSDFNNIVPMPGDKSEYCDVCAGFHSDAEEAAAVNRENDGA